MGLNTNHQVIDRLLHEAEGGSADVVDQLLPLVYDELKLIAQQHRARMGPSTSPSTTSIVHEAYLRLSSRENVNWESRAQFFYLASLVMRHLLVDNARRQSRMRHGGDIAHVSAEVVPLKTEGRNQELLSLDAAIEDLSKENRRLAKVVICRFYGGLNIDETAETLRISSATVKRDWRLAQALLFQSLRDNSAVEDRD